VNLGNYIAKITNEKNVSTEFSFQVLGGLDDNSKIDYEYSDLGGQYVEGSGLFLDTNIFAKTKVHLFLYNNGEWSFGENNNLPLRKLFTGSFVKKDDDGNYLIVVINRTEIKLYEDENWKLNTISYNRQDFSFSEIDSYNAVSNALSSTEWDDSMNFYTIGDIKKGSVLFYRTKKEEYVKLPKSFEATFYDDKYFYQFSKGVVTSSEIGFGYDYSKTNQDTIDKIRQVFDKLLKTPYQSNGKFTYYTAGTREIDKVLYYTTALGRIEKISVLAFAFELFDGEYSVSIENGKISKISETTTTTTTQMPTENIVTFETAKRKGKKVFIKVRTNTGYWKATYEGTDYEITKSSRGLSNGLEIMINESSEMTVSPCDENGSITGDITGLSLNECQVTSIDLSNLSSLKYLDLGRNIIKSIDLSNCSDLLTLNLSRNSLESISLSNLTNLKHLNLSYNKLTSINTSALSSITLLYVKNNILSTFSMYDLNNLIELNLKTNSISRFDYRNSESAEIPSHLENEGHLKSYEEEVAISQSSYSLLKLYLNNNQLSTIDVSPLNRLNILKLSNNVIENIDVTMLRYLFKLNLSNNKLSSFDASGLYSIRDLYLKSNNLQAEAQDTLLNTLFSNRIESGYLRTELSLRTSISEDSYRGLISFKWRIICTDCPDVNVDPMSGYLADDLEYLSFEDGLYLLSELKRSDIDIPDILDPIKPDREVREELVR
jgi:Leucine-rich repeat (LRR) protein